MAQTNEPRTFEEYNFQEFLKMKKENDSLKNNIKDMQEQMDFVERNHTHILDLLKLALSNARVEEETTYTKLYVNDDFVGLFNPNFIEDSDHILMALESLIRIVHALPQREE